MTYCVIKLTPKITEKGERWLAYSADGLEKLSLHGERQSERRVDFKRIKNLNLTVKMIEQVEETVGKYLGDQGEKYIYICIYVYTHVCTCRCVCVYRKLESTKF